jgi:hypothetical protein
MDRPLKGCWHRPHPNRRKTDWCSRFRMPGTTLGHRCEPRSPKTGSSGLGIWATAACNLLMVSRRFWGARLALGAA